MDAEGVAPEDRQKKAGKRGRAMILGPQCRFDANRDHAQRNNDVAHTSVGTRSVIDGLAELRGDDFSSTSRENTVIALR